MDEATRTGLA